MHEGQSSMHLLPLGPWWRRGRGDQATAGQGPSPEVRGKASRKGQQ